MAKREKMLKRLRKYQNFLDVKHKTTPPSNRRNYAAQAVKDSTSMPKTLSYEDIDQAFKKWVETELFVTFEGKEIPTYAMMSIQRFGEYMQTWNGTDENGNILMNFKAITREINPKKGTLIGSSWNIPGEPYFLMRRVLMSDKNGREYIKEYRRKIPTYMDISYSVSIVTNKISLINEFNALVLEKFSSMQAYIFPNGYALPMILDDISDESEYQLDNRQFFTQTFNITLMGYVVKESDFIVEEVPIPKVYVNEERKNSSVVEIETFEPGEDPYYNQPITLTVTFKPEENNVKFKINTDFVVENIELENLRDVFFVRVNDSPSEKLFSVKSDDQIYIYNARKLNNTKEGKVVFKGYNPNKVFDRREDYPEIPQDNQQKSLDVKIGD